MALYEYECGSCGHRFEIIQKMSDPPLDTCPKCGGTVRKLQSAPAFHLKGSGWYVTDYAKKDSSSGGAAKSGAENKETKDAKDTSDAKEAKSSDKGEKAAEPAKTATTTTTETKS